MTAGSGERCCRGGCRAQEAKASLTSLCCESPASCMGRSDRIPTHVAGHAMLCFAQERPISQTSLDVSLERRPGRPATCFWRHRNSSTVQSCRRHMSSHKRVPSSIRCTDGRAQKPQSWNRRASYPEYRTPPSSPSAEALFAGNVTRERFYYNTAAIVMVQAQLHTSINRSRPALRADPPLRSLTPMLSHADAANLPRLTAHKHS